MKFHCPQCSQKCEADEEYAGMSVPCPNCGETVIIPPAAASSPPPKAVAPRVVIPAVSVAEVRAAAPPRRMAPVPQPVAPVPGSPRRTPPRKKGGGCFGNLLILSLVAVVAGGYAAGRHYGGLPQAWNALRAAVTRAVSPEIQREDRLPAVLSSLPTAPANPPAIVQTDPAAEVVAPAVTPQTVTASEATPQVTAIPAATPPPVPTRLPQLAPSVPTVRNAPAFAWQSDLGNGTYKNPILYADYSDPDIVRVGKDFYLVSSSFVKSPGLGLLHSRDLVNWEKVSNIAASVDGGPAFDLKGATAYEDGFWAPSIRYSRGTFYVAVQPTFAAGRIYYASNPAGPWKFYQLDRGIYDPGLFVDTDGTGYIVCGHSPQSLMKLSPDFSRIVEEKKSFLDSKAEGSHMVRRGRYYYVFNANPSAWPFQLLCSRTTSLTNPKWETRVALTATTGGHQGAIVDTDDADHWYGFVHQDSGAVGRMPQLGPVFWENDWPIFGTPAKRDVIAEVNPKPINGLPLGQVATSDDFDKPVLGPQWQWNHNPDNTRWSLTERPGFLRLHPTTAAGFWTARNTLTQKGQGPTCQGVVKLDLAGMKPGDIAGFGTLGKVNGSLYVTADARGQKTLGMRMLKDKVGSYDGAAGIPLSGNTVYLRTDLDFVANLARCSYSTDGARWTPVGGNFELLFGYGTDWQGEKFALYCYNPQENLSPGYVDVDFFKFTGLDADADTVRVQRDRPHLNAARTTFVADNEQLLRGAYGSTEWTKAPSVQEVARVKELGLNAVHLYAETYDPKYPASGSKAPGYAQTEVDKYVAITRDLGLYLVVTVGNGANNGKYNRQWTVDFWKFYAARYARETHVLFEVQNEPVAWGPPYTNPKATPPEAVPMEVDAYKTIRTAAPDTPVLLFSYSVLGEKGGQEALKDIKAFNEGVGGDPAKIWSNAAVAFHGYAGHTNVPQALSDILGADYPCFMTEFIAAEWGGVEGQDVELTATLERLGISWLTFLTVPPAGVSPLVTLSATYKDRCNHTGLNWVPDYGTWPMKRGVYGNGGQPRDTPTNKEHDVLTGTARFECEDFDTGGREVAYHTNAARPNDGHLYRPAEGVAIRPVSDDGAGFAVHAGAGDWFEYTVFVREPGFYQLGLRYAAERSGAVRCLLGGKEFALQDLPGTGGAQSWRTTGQTVFLEYGQKVLRLEVPQGGCDLNWFELTPTKDGPLAPGVYKIAARGSNLLMSLGVTPAPKHLELAPADGKKTQLWKFEHLGAGQYRISSLEDRSYWSADIGFDKGVNLVGWGGSKPGGQQRFVVHPDGGSYRIAPVSLGLDLCVKGTSAQSGTNVQQRPFKGESPSQWTIQP